MGLTFYNKPALVVYVTCGDPDLATEERVNCLRLKLACFISVLVFVGFVSSCRRQRMTQGVVTTVPTLVGANWVSISMADPLIAKWDNQFIFVDFTSSFQVTSNPVGIRLDDGSIAAPEAELITKAGQRQPLRLARLGEEELVFSSNQIARGRTFYELRIRSPKALNCSRIIWVSNQDSNPKVIVLRFPSSRR
jgi:hypothetical protein